MDKKKMTKKELWSGIACLIGLLVSLATIITAGFLPLPEWGAIVMIVVGFILLMIVVFFWIKLDLRFAEYECKNCGHRFTPTFGGYVNGMHVGTTRVLKCPLCKQRTWCKRRRK